MTIHQPQKSLNQIIDIAKATRLAAIAIDGDVVTSEGLHDKVTDDTAIIRRHTWAVGIKNTHDFYL